MYRDAINHGFLPVKSTNNDIHYLYSIVTQDGSLQIICLGNTHNVTTIGTTLAVW